ncbi:MAG: DinB family protein [Balneola sp.]|nr:MAG: DinB family protein [Balneola sp.]
MHKHTLVIDSNIFFLNQGIELLSDVSDDQYSANDGKYNKSGIGRHFRHIIEHYISLIEEKDGLVDYDARERNLSLELDRSYMIESIGRVIESLRSLSEKAVVLDKTISVRSNEGIGEEGAPLSSSTIRRELQFLISHTVHHYALIGLILKTMGFNPSPEFGVAPSTLKHERSKEIEAAAS